MKFEYKALLTLLIIGLIVWGINLLTIDKDRNYYLSNPEALEEDLNKCIQTSSTTGECVEVIAANQVLIEMQRLQKQQKQLETQEKKKVIHLKPGQQTTDPQAPGYINPRTGTVIRDRTLKCTEMGKRRGICQTVGEYD